MTSGLPFICPHPAPLSDLAIDTVHGNQRRIFSYSCLEQTRVFTSYARITDQHEAKCARLGCGVIARARSNISNAVGGACSRIFIFNSLALGKQ
jgi:hypothetical protein